MSHLRFLCLAIAFCALLAGPLTPSARAAAIPLTFSGGSGAPLTITLSQPVSYTVTSLPNAGVVFAFQGVGNVIGGSVNATGTMSYTVNGGAPISITAGGTGTSLGVLTPTSLYLFKNPAPSAAINDVIVLSPGFVTTAINIPSAAPAAGSYSALLVDSSGAQVGVGVPEPAALSLMAVGGVALLARRRGTRQTLR